jgi:colanic acid/amylovoran biosynthesis protein
MTDQGSHVRILQTGTYSPCNKGDAAMQISTALTLRAALPDAQIYISAPFPKPSAPFYSDVGKVVRCHRRRLVYATFLLGRAALWRLLRDRFRHSADWLIPEAESRETRDADLVVDLSGDMLTDSYGPHVAYSHYLPILLAIALDRPVFICAQSIGPHRWTGFLARWMLQRAACITVRDLESLAHLEAIGIDRDRVTVTADMAFLLQPAAAARCDRLLADEGIRFSTRPVLGVSVSRIVQRRHDSMRQAGTESFVNLMAAVLDRFADQHGVDVLFVPHVTGPFPGKDDRSLAKEVAAAMRARAWCMSGDYRPDELKGVISRCAMFIGARMHANIAALSSGIPVVAISYSHKTPGIMAQFGQQGYVVDGALDAALLNAKLDRLWHDRAEAAETIAHAAIRVLADAQRNVTIAVRLIHRQRTMRS